MDAPVTQESLGPDEETGRRGPGAFVGRERDLGELQAALAEATGRHGSLVLVAGEAGIGKTRLAGELAERARSLGAGVLWGRCWEGEGVPAFWPWIQALRDHTGRQDPGLLRAELGDGAADVALLLPGLAERLGELPPGPPLEPEQARFRLFDAVAGLLKRAGDSQPLLLILDDLHWADRSSLSLLRFVARELHDARVLVVGTYRDLELDRSGEAEPLAGLASGSRRITLGGLARDEVAELLALTTGRPAAPELAADVHRRTGGNPLFVREVARLLASDDHPAIPEGVREVLRRHLDQLPGRCVDNLAVAAVLGQEFRLDLLAAVSGQPLGTQLELLDRAAAFRVVERLPGAVAGYRFAHALLREVLYEGLPAARRVELHRRAGRALEERSAADPSPPLAELAHHFRQAAAAGEAARAAGYAERAGRRALDQLAYAEAAGHFERALEVLELVPPEPARRCELELALAEARMAAGEIALARGGFERTARLARAAGAAEPLARAALGLGAELPAPRVDDLQVRLLEEALQALEDDGALRARLLARLGRALVFTPAYERRAALCEQAVAIARRAGDQATLAAVLYDWHLAAWRPDNPEERLAVASEVVELAERCGDRALALQGRGLRTADLLELGDLPALRAEIEAYERAAARLRQLHYLWHVPLLEGTLALLAGRLDEAERLEGEGLTIGRRAHDQAVHSYMPILVATVRWLRGRLPELEAPIRERAGLSPAAPAWRIAVVLLLALAGRQDEARAELDWLAARDFTDLPRDHQWLCNMALLALVSQRLDDRRRAAVLYPMLLPYAGRMVPTTRLAIGCLGPVHHYLGILAATLGRLDDAAEHLGVAIEEDTRAGAVPFLALSRHDCAGVLRARGAPGDEELAAELLRAWGTTARALGMPLAAQPPPEGAAAAGAAAGAGANPPSPADPAAPAAGAVFRREGEYWTIAWQGPVLRVRHAAGLAHLARLLSQPGRELHALDLAAGESGTVAGVQAVPVLDEAAKAAYRRRLGELAAELEEAERWADPERAARARAEMDALTDQLAGAVGLGGRDRGLPSDAERARVSVTKAIRAAIRRIAEHDTALGEHLTRTVRTGTFCVYAADPATPSRWEQ
jgi:tetratricopeptide (TPR) repeat protein